MALAPESTIVRMPAYARNPMARLLHKLIDDKGLFLFHQVTYSKAKKPVKKIISSEKLTQIFSILN